MSDIAPVLSVEEARARANRIRSGYEQISRPDFPWPTRQAVTDQRAVYFIQADNGFIKIGVAKNPRARLRTLQAMSPVRLRLVLVLPGIGAKGEAELHERFAEHRSHGEWFCPASEILAYIRGQK